MNHTEAAIMNDLEAQEDHPPKTLNGYPVIASKPRRGGGWRIVCWREGHPVHSFVVASWHKNNPDQWHWGRYYATGLEAFTDFEEA